MKQIVRTTLAAALAAATFAHADTPATGPAAPADEASTQPGPPRPREGRFGGGRNDDRGPLTKEEWTEVERFMQDNSPVRFELLKKIEGVLGPDHRIARMVRRRVAERYRSLDALKNRGGDMYPFALKQLQIEDQVLGTMRAQRAADADQAKLSAELDAELRNFVDNYLGERQARIDRLKQIVERESASLAKDRASTDDLVKAQLDKFKKEVDAMLDFDAKSSRDDDAAPSATKPAE